MQTRTGFNAGELSPEMAARCDMDAYMRGCRTLENWELSQMGGIRRRRGMRQVTGALGNYSRLFPYIYSYSKGDQLRFLVEVGYDQLRVLDLDGQQAAFFESGKDECLIFSLDPKTVRTCQLNAVLLLTSQLNAPLQLRFDGAEIWTLKRWEFSQPPWRYDNERRDYPIIVTRMPGTTGEAVSVTFDDDEEEDERNISEDDVLRASFWMEQQEAFELGSNLRQGVQIVTEVPASASYGDKFAIHTDDTIRYYVCKQEFPSDVYVSGLDEPSCYPDNFEEVENTSGFESVTPVYSVHEVNGGSTIAKGTKLAIKSGYWELFTCVSEFTEADRSELLPDFSDYEGFFIRGIAIGDALPCRGKWAFYCSGLWYGSYEVRRNYESSSLTSPEWESAGISFSRVSSASNTEISGDESDEECYVRLFITRSKHMGTSLADGWTPDACGNRLIVYGYRHDMTLKAWVMDSGVQWEIADRIAASWTGRKIIYNWSWNAFSDRYGYPLTAAVYDQRLVFASTLSQYQSLWFSRVDELDNFATGDSDSSAIALTLNSPTQNPICWLKRHRHSLLLGTSDAEYALSPSSNGATITPTDCRLEQHGYLGSDGGLCLETNQVLLYIERGGKRCHEFSYSIEIDGYRSKDLTVCAPHVLSDHGGPVQATLMTKPDVCAVFSLADGQLALCTYNTQHEVNAWHRWVTNGNILSVCALPDDAGNDRLYLVVERGSSVNIEVVDDNSPYCDNGGMDYVSTLVTNALGNPLEEPVQKKPKAPVAVLFREDVPTRAIEVCSDGSPWVPPSRDDPTLPKGWNKLLYHNTWEYENAIGIRCSGQTGCHLLAIQG